MNGPYRTPGRPEEQRPPRDRKLLVAKVWATALGVAVVALVSAGAVVMIAGTWPVGGYVAASLVFLFGGIWALNYLDNHSRRGR